MCDVKVNSLSCVWLFVTPDSLPAEPQGKPKNTRVGRLFLLQGIFPSQESNLGLLRCRQLLYQLSHQGSPCAVLFQSCLTLWDPMDYSPLGSSTHRIIQARIPEWVAMPSSRGSYWPRDLTCVCLLFSPAFGEFFTSWTSKQRLALHSKV